MEMDPNHNYAFLYQLLPLVIIKTLLMLPKTRFKRLLSSKGVNHLANQQDLNRPHLSQPQPQPQPTTMVSNVLGIPSFDPIDTLPLNKTFRKKKQSTCSTLCNVYYTIIDASIDKCKATKKSICSNDFGKASSKNHEETFEQHDSIVKGKRRFSLLSTIQENYEKEKEATL
ncbi:unnamed protein product [Miscanthus lutarioriparius]|uniref:Uncharacterized protein n=1 Tax=Miscanthus lutarioriparius TaxID=422564 RepID=A0A811QGJ6_9POAL|nr:unnamed protein product [Miscanthus lutarioriparius]